MGQDNVRRFTRFRVHIVIVVIAALVTAVGIAGVHQANEHARALERRLARAVAPLNERDAVALFVSGPSSVGYTKLQRQVGTEIFIEQQGHQVSAEAKSWWPFAPRCVVALHTSTGWRTYVDGSGDCPP